MKRFFTQTVLLLAVLLAGTSAKAVTYKIDGPADLTTNAVYKIVTTDGSALPAGLTATWDYPSDFYRISYSSTTIELGRKTAEGYYTLKATLSDGTFLKKEIHAIKDSGSGGGTITPPVTQNEVTLDVRSISDKLFGSYENINQYTLASRHSFTTTTGELYIKCMIKNNTNAPMTIETSNLKIAYGYRESPYTATVYTGGGTPINSLYLINGYNYDSEIILKVPSNWRLKTTSDNYTYIDLYFLYTHISGQQLFNGSFCIINSSNSVRSNQQPSISVYPSTVTSDVTIKSTDESPIKSIKIVGTMGNMVKSKLYSGDCTEANLDLSNCKNGIYYIQVEKANGVETSKIIKK